MLEGEKLRCITCVQRGVIITPVPKMSTEVWSKMTVDDLVMLWEGEIEKYPDSQTYCFDYYRKTPELIEAFAEIRRIYAGWDWFMLPINNGCAITATRK